jgi:hypothetical protein
MRKAFKFYRSYWEIGSQLNDAERLKFYDALLKLQFTGKCDALTGMSNFAMLSQKHSIDLQIDGYLAQWYKKNPNEDPWQGGNIGPSLDPTMKEKEKEKEKVKSNVDIDFYFNKFWDAFDKKVDRAKCLKSFMKIKPDLFDMIIIKASEYKLATPEIKYRKNPLTWLNGQCWDDQQLVDQPKKIMAFHPIIFD